MSKAARMTIAEFGRYCQKRKPRHYTYLTDNQETDYRASEFMRLVFRCRSMVVCLKPDRLAFLNNGNCVTFEAPRYIEVFDDGPCSVVIFKVHYPDRNREKVAVWMME